MIDDVIKVPVKDRFLSVEIRESDFPEIPQIWTPWVNPVNSQGDGKGRARLIMVDIYGERVLGIYHGGGTQKEHYVTPISAKAALHIESNLPWAEYRINQ